VNAAKHTPGPWSFLEEGRTEEEGNRGRPLTVCGGPGGSEDLVNVYSRDDATVSIVREEAIANARLIAAAPELLEACEEALGTLNGAEIALPGYVVSALERAIAKATGGTPGHFAKGGAL
jgi:hypothetical protein